MKIIAAETMTSSPVTQYHIASYLGVSYQHLSRLKSVLQNLNSPLIYRIWKNRINLPKRLEPKLTTQGPDR
jgi:hypothetical protein